MKKIILACSAGMSTSILVSKMKKEAAARSIELNIEAIPESTIKEELEGIKDSVIAILLGPQVRMRKKPVAEIAAPYGIPVDVIDTIAYGRGNGAAVLDQALKLAGES
ncbi:PTS sugar transporter subunit IIB [Paenibacillus terrae]|uniref:PTS cellobiose transporter subunit IIB n=1 Tax=Paenibacillus terrae TaxID=159743 RepID=A0A0D7X4Y1_9BACL|nr:PTS sugar transporter subunit IIB [Paenibacillus terrae]KJD46033.1 PTS cellobiose transporter subunit IIB [Paenibacillus terrae]